MTVSGDLIGHTRDLYLQSIQVLDPEQHKLYGFNAHSDLAYPAYICAVASVEAFTNELFLNASSEHAWSDSILWRMPKRWRNELGLLNKLLLFPALIAGQSFDPGHQPFQSMAQLVRVRNDLTHFHLKHEAPSYIKDLEDKGLALESHSSKGDYPWPAKLSCTEGIRWAHNTACDVAQELGRFIEESDRFSPLLRLVQNFTAIPDEFVIEQLASKGYSVAQHNVNRSGT